MDYQGLSSSPDGCFDRAATDMTRHAGIRVQQRGVKRDVLDCLLAFGRHEPDHKGCHIVTFDGKTLDDLSRFEPKELNAKATSVRNLYAVVDGDGIVVTTGHRFRRVPRDISLSSFRSGRSRNSRAINTADNLFGH